MKVVILAVISFASRSHVLVVWAIVLLFYTLLFAVQCIYAIFPVNAVNVAIFSVNDVNVAVFPVNSVNAAIFSVNDVNVADFW